MWDKALEKSIMQIHTNPIFNLVYHLGPCLTAGSGSQPVAVIGRPAPPLTTREGAVHSLCRCGKVSNGSGSTMHFRMETLVFRRLPAPRSLPALNMSGSKGSLKTLVFAGNFPTAAAAGGNGPPCGMNKFFIST